MLCTVSQFLSFTVLLSAVVGAPQDHKIRRHYRKRPWHGPHTASETTTATTTTYPGGNAYDGDTYPTPSQPYNGVPTPGNGSPSSGLGSPVDDDEDQFYAQTTMPPSSTDPYQGGEFYQQPTPSVNEELFDVQPTPSLGLERAAVVNPLPSNGPQPSGGPTASSGECPTAELTPQCYQLASQFPSPNEWMSWECLVSNSRTAMVGSSNDGPDEADAAIAAIESVAQTAGIDPRIPFALMMQESSGKVRPIIGDYGLSFGLFQVQNADIPLCDDYAKNECPESVIRTQVEYGIYGHEGTGSAPVAPGIAHWLGAEDGDVGRALRGYNTGSVDDPSDLTNIPSGGTAS
ncbi:MAG: hypothetical protein Q9174_007353, partial [Haloplaca sp. 1 TL-2023]